MDRFSNLPEEVAHRILEFVSSKDISRLSVVSKRFQLLCLSTPALHFDDYGVINNAAKRAQLMNYVDRVLCRLPLARDIPAIKLDWCELSDEQQEFRFVSWIHRASQCRNVRELRFIVASLRDASGLSLPSASILSCASLEILELRFRKGGAGGGIPTFKIPPAHLGSPFSSLKSLILDTVQVEESLFEWISQCCKSLSSLSLDSMYLPGGATVTIASSSLTYLFLSNPYTRMNLQVDAENLEVLVLVWLATGSWKASKPKLNTPKCRITHQVMVQRISSGCMRLHEIRNSALFDDPFDLLRVNFVMHEFAKWLVIMDMYGDTIEDMYERGLLPFNMPNLTWLNLHVHRDPYNVDLVSLMASFLKGTPRLQNLYIGFPSPVVTTQEEGDMEMVQHVPPELKNCSIPKLKIMQFAFPCGVQKNKLELINYFINSTDKMRILCHSKLPFNVYSQIKAYEKKAASNAKVYVVCYDQGKPYIQ